MKENWFQQACSDIDTESLEQAKQHQQLLTKPPGALGTLEDVAIRLAGMQCRKLPEIEDVQITVFAADHGIADQGVSAFPQAVTAEMVKNFSRGGAAINVLARENDSALNVVNMGTAFPVGQLSNVIDKSIASGTKDFSKAPAMTHEQMLDALYAGAEIADDANHHCKDLFIAGEMGIANTSSATALACCLLDKKAEEIAGPGTGLDKKGVKNKAKVINDALAFHKLNNSDALAVLQTFGGFEIAAICGAYIRCAQLGIPVLVDGFISTAAALVANHIQPESSNWFFFSHASAEPGHKLLMQSFEEQPLLDLGMRLGEGSGAALAIPLIKSACALHSQMATFEAAGVSEKNT